MKWIDLPPVWLACAIALLWLERELTGGISLPAVLIGLGWTLIATGLLITGLAAVSFLRARTSIIPRQTPDALITTGLFAMSRNPIYLADALMLAGAGLVLGAVSTLVLLPGFVWLVTHRFIRGEEAGLAAKFQADWERYSTRVGRWF